MPWNGGRRAARVPRTTTNQSSTTSTTSTNNDIVDVKINAEHSAIIRETEDHFKLEKTVIDHNRQLKEMIKWVETEYPDYYQESVVELTDEQKADRKRYYTSTHDFLYGNLNVNVTKAFLATKKIPQEQIDS